MIAEEYFATKGIALQGHDVVAFHTDGLAVKGSKSIFTVWSGVTWWFVSKEHKLLFEENPEKFAPQFGGFCAYGASCGYKADIRINTFTIIDGMLYFNYTSYVKRFWVEHQGRLIKKGNDHWSAVRKMKPIKTLRPYIYIKYQFYRLLGKDFFAETSDS